MRAFTLSLFITSHSINSSPFSSRILLNVMYIMVETLRRGVEGDSNEWNKLRENFLQDLGEKSISHSSCFILCLSLPFFTVVPVTDNESLAVILFGMVTKFCSGTAPHFPMKKVLLLLWKVILVNKEFIPLYRIPYPDFSTCIFHCLPTEPLHLSTCPFILVYGIFQNLGYYKWLFNSCNL